MTAAAGSNLGLFPSLIDWADRMVDPETDDCAPVTVPGAGLLDIQGQPSASGSKNREFAGETQAQEGASGSDPERLGTGGNRGFGSSPGLIPSDPAALDRLARACSGGSTVSVWRRGYGSRAASPITLAWPIYCVTRAAKGQLP